MNISEIKKNIIESIKEKGFPVGYITECGDFYAGYFVKSPDDIVSLGYANNGKNKKLDELELVELAMLLEYGCREGDEDWDSFLSAVKEELQNG